MSQLSWGSIKRTVFSRPRRSSHCETPSRSLGILLKGIISLSMFPSRRISHSRILWVLIRRENYHIRSSAQKPTMMVKIIVAYILRAYRHTERVPSNFGVITCYVQSSRQSHSVSMTLSGALGISVGLRLTLSSPLASSAFSVTVHPQEVRNDDPDRHRRLPGASAHKSVSAPCG